MPLPAQVLIRYETEDWMPPRDGEALNFFGVEIKAGAEPWRPPLDGDPLGSIRRDLRALGYHCRPGVIHVGSRGSRSNPTIHLETWVKHGSLSPKTTARTPGSEPPKAADATTSATADYTPAGTAEQLRMQAGF